MTQKNNHRTMTSFRDNYLFPILELFVKLLSIQRADRRL